MQDIYLALLLKAVLYGLALAAGDQAAIVVRKKHGQQFGLATWLVLVFLPLAMLLAFAPLTALGSGLVATVLSGSIFWYSRRKTSKPISPMPPRNR